MAPSRTGGNTNCMSCFIPAIPVPLLIVVVVSRFLMDYLGMTPDSMNGTAFSTTGRNASLHEFENALSKLVATDRKSVV